MHQDSESYPPLAERWSEPFRRDVVRVGQHIDIDSGVLSGMAGTVVRADNASWILVAIEGWPAGAFLKLNRSR